MYTTGYVIISWKMITIIHIKSPLHMKKGQYVSQDPFFKKNNNKNNKNKQTDKTKRTNKQTNKTIRQTMADQSILISAVLPASPMPYCFTNEHIYSLPELAIFDTIQMSVLPLKGISCNCVHIKCKLNWIICAIVQDLRERQLSFAIFLKLSKKLTFHIKLYKAACKINLLCKLMSASLKLISCECVQISGKHFMCASVSV